ncbi:uncharacterized protein (DUF2252 family) [Palleronia aestuarii]|uniref:Uncharacterized protein (DUF2252 family) n=1 Tax=Palleronia aestuarii TaxID=568105 RepID=A0A2W7Q4J5_9RHOB|nr:DUF2252 family protein [Palleronia aestuarii]PZX16609.1 uncharacterized protein (DUF2252 family) [Palleronia aestuarii]
MAKRASSKSADGSSGGSKSGSSKSSKAKDQPKVVAVHKSEGRVDAFRKLSQRIAEGDQVVPPAMLTGEARRNHVRSTLREDHQTRIEERSMGAEVKFDKLASSRFKFFRGTALLFYRDMVGIDSNMPSVMALGDVHPENFGIMPNSDGAPIFSVNDFDETIYAPFTWDLKRGGVGFWVAAHDVAGFSKKKRRKIIARFVKGYLDAMENYAQYATEKNDDYRMDNSPKVIRRLFKEAYEERREWLWGDYLKPNGRGFRADDELQPISSEAEKFQKAVNDLASAKGFEVPDRAGELKVKDVCVRHGQGTASLGLPRYYVLIEGPSKDATDDIIIEFKRARRSALEGLTPSTEFDAGSNAERIAHGQSVQLARGDIFYGAVEIEGTSFMSRERAPFRDDIDLDELSYGTWKEYAEVCGAVLAQAHALSDDLGQIDYDVEPSIVAAASPRPLFIRDIVGFVEEAADRLKEDHRMFCEDHELDAFKNIDMVYR